MRYLSLFSGIEAASVAWMPLGWKPMAFAEVDPFASEVLAKRFPGVTNLGDVTKIDWSGWVEQHGGPDVLVGGSPCQSFSIAGNREGLQGESGLMFEYIRAVRDILRATGGGFPRYIVWENVPGALSSEHGNAFGQLLAELDDLGYGLAWRVLDAQFVRVPGGPRRGFTGPVAQRRRRVFLVGVLGNPGAAEILFERQSMRGDNPSSREARKALAGDAAEGAGIGGCAGFKWFAGARAKGIGYEDGTSPTLTNSDGHTPAVLTPWDVQSKRIYSEDAVSPCLPSGTGEGMNIQPSVLQSLSIDHKQTPHVSEGMRHTLTHEGDGGIHSAVCVKVRGESSAKTSGSALTGSPCVLTPWDSQSKRVYSENGTSPTLCSNEGRGIEHNQPIVLQSDGSSSNGSQNGCGYNEDGVGYTLNGRDKQAICIQGSMVGRTDGNGPQGDGLNSELSFTLNTSDRHAVAFAQNTRDEVRIFQDDGSVVGALSAQPGMKQTSYVCMTDTQPNTSISDETCGTLSTHTLKDPPVVAFDVRNMELKDDVSGTLQAKENGGYSLNYINPVVLPYESE